MVKALVASKESTRLLRIEVTSLCNYKCAFCFQKRSTQESIQLLKPSDYTFLAECLVSSGCHRVSIDGGEPLLIDCKKLCNIIKYIKSVKGIEFIFITTNGSYLSEEYAKNLVASGLDQINFSIPADNNPDYLRCTGCPTHISVNTIFLNAKNAINAGLKLRVNVPLSKKGIHSYKQLISLIDQAKKFGVKNFAYFKMHKSLENEDRFSSLNHNICQDEITNNFSSDPRWRVITIGRSSYFSDGEVSVVAPMKIKPETTVCKQISNLCGDYCQGTYASYFISKQKEMHIRACHRVFADGLNEFTLKKKLFDKKDKQRMISILNKVWSWSAGSK